MPAGSATSGYTLNLGGRLVDTLTLTASGGAFTNVLTVDSLLVCAASPMSPLTPQSGSKEN